MISNLNSAFVRIILTNIQMSLSSELREIQGRLRLDKVIFLWCLLSAEILTDISNKIVTLKPNNVVWPRDLRCKGHDDCLFQFPRTLWTRRAAETRWRQRAGRSRSAATPPGLRGEIKYALNNKLYRAYESRRRFYDSINGLKLSGMWDRQRLFG